MTQQNRKFRPAREIGAESRIDPAHRPADEMQYEVAQRGTAKDAHEQESGDAPLPSAPQTSQTSGYGNREDRENPGQGLQQSGTAQSHELAGEGTRVGTDEPK